MVLFDVVLFDVVVAERREPSGLFALQYDGPDGLRHSATK